MSLALNLSNFATRVATEFKTLRTLVTGSATGGLTGLTTTDKTSIIAAINETKAGNSGTPPDATETVKGIAEVATQAETNTGTADTVFITPLKFQTRLAAYAQPLAANLTTLAGVASTAIGRSILSAADASAVKALLSLVKADVGLGNVPNVDATARSSHTGTQAVGTITGLGYFATGTDAANLTGTLNTAQLPSLAINDTFPVANQAAMLALTAQRGDIAIRTDISRNFILTAEPASTLANWTQLAGGSDVTSVAGRTGTVVLTKTDVGLANVDNTSDANKPVSTAQATALGTKQPLDATLTALAGVTVAANQVILASGPDAFTAFTTGVTGRNLLADATPAAARTELSVYSQAEIGDPEQDLVAIFNAGLI